MPAPGTKADRNQAFRIPAGLVSTRSHWSEGQFPSPAQDLAELADICTETSWESEQKQRTCLYLAPLHKTWQTVLRGASYCYHCLSQQRAGNKQTWIFVLVLTTDYEHSYGKQMHFPTPTSVPHSMGLTTEVCRQNTAQLQDWTNEVRSWEYTAFLHFTIQRIIQLEEDLQDHLV